MADSAHLDLWHRLADAHPSHVAWARCSAGTRTELTLNGVLLSRDPACFPLCARIRVYDGGRLVGEGFSPEIGQGDTRVVAVNDIVPGLFFDDAYTEINVFPTDPSRLRQFYYGELWCSVYDGAGTAFNYPPLNFKGVDVKMLDANCLYYPGVTVADSFAHEIVILNQYAFDSVATLTVYNAAGDDEVRVRLALPRKSATRVRLSEIVPDAVNFFADGPGLFVARFPFKMNAFVQTVRCADGSTCGMDHLGYLSVMEAADPRKVVDPVLASARRLDDPVVCYCQSVPESHLRACRNRGQGLRDVVKSCGAGEICKGCVAELREFFAPAEAATSSP